MKYALQGASKDPNDQPPKPAPKSDKYKDGLEYTGGKASNLILLTKDDNVDNENSKFNNLKSSVYKEVY